VSDIETAVWLPTLKGKKFYPGQEQAFKKEMIQKSRNSGLTVFEIENEEKEPGFPDSEELYILKGSTLIEQAGLGIGGIALVGLTFVEYKVSNEKGLIEFEPKQPLFYRKHATLPIVVRAWSVPDQLGFEYQAYSVLKRLIIRQDGSIWFNVRGGFLE